MKIINKKSIFILVLAIAVLALGSFLYIRKSSNVAAALPLPKVSLITVAKHNLNLSVQAYGTVDAPLAATVKSQISGVVENVNFKPGQHVGKNFVLLKIKTPDIKDNVTSAYTKMIQEKDHYERLKKLYEAVGGASKQEVDDAKSSYLQAKAAHASVFNKLSFVNVKAPVSGTVTDTSLATGDYLTVGEVIASIFNDQNLEVKYSLPQSLRSKVKLGQQVKVSSDVDSGKSFVGLVKYISPDVDSDSSEFSLRASIANTRGTLPPGSYVTVTQITDKGANVVAIDQKQLQTDELGFYVFTLKDNKLTRQAVTVGSIDSNGYVEIIKGLKAGDKIVDSAAGDLSLGQKVVVESK